LARAAELRAHDAAYVELALRMSLPLATADDFLAQAAVAAGAELLRDRAT
jgi:predicted nucleic acid-binding protein